MERKVAGVNLDKLKNILKVDEGYHAIVRLAQTKNLNLEILFKELFGDGSKDGFVMRCVLKGIPKHIAELVTSQTTEEKLCTS